MTQALLFAGSLAAILLLALAARVLALGGGEIGDEAAAIAHAEAMLPGFDGVQAVIGSDGQAALVRGRDGSVALLKVHGAQVAARRLHAPQVERTPEGLRVASGERRFGTVLIRGADDSLLTSV